MIRDNSNSKREPLDNSSGSFSLGSYPDEVGIITRRQNANSIYNYGKHYNYKDDIEFAERGCLSETYGICGIKRGSNNL